MIAMILGAVTVRKLMPMRHRGKREREGKEAERGIAAI